MNLSRDLPPPESAAPLTARRRVPVWLGWWDSWALVGVPRPVTAQDRVQWGRLLPFVLLHLAALPVLWMGGSAFAIGCALGYYLLRMFAITAFYHRYFAHKTFRTSRPVHFVFGLLGVLAGQRGPLWWAAHHRMHHCHADQAEDPHSPRQGFWHSHCLWLMRGEHAALEPARVRDWLAYPELVFLDRFSTPLMLGSALLWYATGELLAHHWPGLGTSGLELLLWCFVLSTLAVLHVTLSINSLAHRWGRRRFDTDDDSRNNFWLALLTLGEGWHNNHHRYMGSTRQGFFWWEIDLSWLLLRLMAALGLVWGLRGVPERIYAEARQ